MRNQVLVCTLVGMMIVACSGMIGGVKIPKTSVSKQTVQETKTVESNIADETSTQNNVKAKNNETVAEQESASESIKVTEIQTTDKAQEESTVQNEEITTEASQTISLSVKAENIAEMNLVGYEGKGKIVKDKDAIESFINLVESIDASEPDSVEEDEADFLYGFRAVELTDAAGNKTVISFSGNKYVCVDDKKYELNASEDEFHDIYEEINRLFGIGK